jgi:hypothetical protein
MQGLRLHDNPALIEAASSTTLYPVFCLDPWFIASGNVGANRLNFLLQSLKNLHENLQKCNSRLIVLHGDPKEAIPAVVKALGVQTLCFEKDTEPYAISRDAAVTVAVKELDCEVRSILIAAPVLSHLSGISIETARQNPSSVCDHLTTHAFSSLTCSIDSKDSQSGPLPHTPCISHIPFLCRLLAPFAFWRRLIEATHEVSCATQSTFWRSIQSFRERSRKAQQFMRSLHLCHLQVKSLVGHTLWDSDYLIAKNHGKAPETMSSFTALTRRIPAPSKPLDAPEKLPEAPVDLSSIDQWLWNGTANVPSAADLQLELPNDGAGAPFKV